MLNKTGQRSETERHFDQICMGLITIGTAALAAVLLISGLIEGRPDPRITINLVKMILTGASGMAYALTVMLATAAIFQDPRTAISERDSKKTDETALAFRAMGVLITLAAAMILSIIFIPTDASWWNGETSRTVRVSEKNWERLEAIAGREGTDDEKVSKLLNAAGASEDQARTSLEEQLKEFEWFKSVRTRSTQLIVRVNRRHPEAEQAVPQNWWGIPVVIRETRRE